MKLAEVKKLDGKCRLLIPTQYIIGAGGKPDGLVYVTFDESTKEIKIIVKKEENQ